MKGRTVLTAAAAVSAFLATAACSTSDVGTPNATRSSVGQGTSTVGQGAGTSTDLVTGTTSPSAAASSASTTSPTTSPTTVDVAPAGQPWSGAVPMQPGRRPPQFVVVSFDGASWHPLMQHWLDTARRADARFTFFLSGIYLVPADRAAQLYHPPGHRPGASDIGFSTVPEIRVEIEDLRRAYAAGHEIGTHFNGHFCGSSGVNRWTAAQWSSELTQFTSFVDNWQANTGITDLAPLPFTSADIRGGRTPCLEGRTAPLLTAERRAGFRYDASRTGYLSWPQRFGGLWEFPLPSITLAGTDRTVLAMDYNFYYAQSRATPAAAGARPGLRRQVIASYQGAFDAVYDGNRAPLILGNHFNRWNGGIYTDALTDFLLRTCGRPQVRCVSFSQLADWLDAQTPATRARLQALRPVR